MRAYIISIALCTVIGAIMNILAPDKWSKYIGIITGLVVTVCIARPIIALVAGDTLPTLTYTPTDTIGIGEDVLYTEIKAELEKRIDNDVVNRLRTEFGRECVARSEVAVSPAGEVEGVRCITVTGDRIDNIVIGRLRDVYGAEEVRYGGAEKTAGKSE